MQILSLFGDGFLLFSDSSLTSRIRRPPINVYRPLNPHPPTALLSHYNLLSDSAHAMVTQQLAQGHLSGPQAG